jgi:hypothetical protein
MSSDDGCFGCATLFLAGVFGMVAGGLYLDSRDKKNLQASISQEKMKIRRGLEEALANEESIDAEILSVLYSAPTNLCREKLTLTLRDYASGNQIQARPYSQFHNLDGLASALQAEKNDGDEDRISFKGHYENNTFIITYAKTEVGEFSIPIDRSKGAEK